MKQKLKFLIFLIVGRLKLLNYVFHFVYVFFIIIFIFWLMCYF